VKTDEIGCFHNHIFYKHPIIFGGAYLARCKIGEATTFVVMDGCPNTLIKHL